MLTPTVLNVNTLCSSSNKHLCHNVNTTLPIINGINNHRCQLVLIVIRRYAVAKLSNQYYGLLVTQQIVRKLRHTKPFRINPTNQGNLSTSVNTRKNKRYIGLTIKVLKIVLRVSIQYSIRTARRLTTLTKALKKWLPIFLELRRFAQNVVLLSFPNHSYTSTQKSAAQDHTSYALSSYSVRLTNFYCQSKGDYTIVGIGLDISRLDVCNRVYHTRISPSFFRLRSRCNRLSWHKLLGNTYWQGMASEPPLSPKNKYHVNFLKS